MSPDHCASHSEGLLNLMVGGLMWLFGSGVIWPSDVSPRTTRGCQECDPRQGNVAPHLAIDVFEGVVYIS
jgi:hypothetical protein